jgi:predicted CXXCH cytochrome family protein
MKTIKQSLYHHIHIFIFRPLGLLLFIGLFLNQLPVMGQTKSREKTCVECHKNTVAKNFVHGPVATDCMSCHVATGEKHPVKTKVGFTLKAQGAELCYSCHTELHTKLATLKRKHTPIKKGECLKCHDIHSSNDSKLVSATSPALCYTCHKKLKKVVENSKIVHLPVTKEGGCLICHAPHASKQKKLLTAQKKDLCLSCHNKTIKDGVRKIANIDKLLKDSKVQHPALKKGCSGCHTAHATNNNFLLKIAFPTSNYAKGTQENYELCFNCHDSDLLLVEKTTTATEFRDKDHNLHYVHVNKEKGRACVNCHNMHGSSRKHLVPETIKFGSWDMPLKYIPTETGGSCASGCHKEKHYNR